MIAMALGLEVWCKSARGHDESRSYTREGGKRRLEFELGAELAFASGKELKDLAELKLQRGR